MGQKYVYRKKRRKSAEEIHLSHVIGEIGNTRGQQAEEKVAKAFQTLQEAGVITEFTHLSRLAQHQNTGIDFFATAASGRKISLQVKSSFGGLRRHNYQHPNIIAIVVKPEVSQPELIRLLCKALRLTYTPV